LRGVTVPVASTVRITSARVIGANRYLGAAPSPGFLSNQSHPATSSDRIAANAAATETAEQIETAAKTAAKAEFMTADTYRAATMSIRADYGKGESKTVKAIDRVKSINEKIKSATESSAAALANLGLV
jgi:flagellar capping protein FliD